MKSKVEIKQLESGGFSIKLDDKEENGITSGEDIHMGLQVASNIVRSEFTKKGDWYNALVASIFGYLQETDGSIPYDQMAIELANRIVGIESYPAEESECGPEDYEF